VTVDAQLPTAGRGFIADSKTSSSCDFSLGSFSFSHHFDPSVEITMHHVGAADPELIDGAEVNNPRVFEEPAEDRAHGDVLGVSRTVRPQSTDAAHHHLDAHSGLRSAVQRVRSPASSTNALAFIRIRPLHPRVAVISRSMRSMIPLRTPYGATSRLR